MTHTPTGRMLSYGALAEIAAKLPVPAQVALKDPKDFKLIGTPAKRLDTPAKVNGKAEYGIDVRLPGMKIATVAASPVVGGKLVSVDDAKAQVEADLSAIVEIVASGGLVGAVASLRDGRAHRRVVPVRASGTSLALICAESPA